MQTANCLREALQKGEWCDYLPGGRALCGRLQVSRYTLQLALLVLQKEGLVQIAHGRRVRIAVRAPVAARRVHAHIVGAITTASLEEMEASTLYLLARLQSHLHAAGFELLLHVDPRLRWQRPSRCLEELIGQTRAACWVLCSVEAATQRWFMDRGIAAMVSGTLHPGIRLPAVSADYGAVCRHAAGQFLNRGHRRVVFLAPKSEIAGDLAGERGFLEAFTQTLPAPALVRHHDRTVGGIRAVLDSVLNVPDRPTGILVADPGHALTVVGHLIKRGLRLPEDISVISRDFAPFLGELVPRVACYRMKIERGAERLSRRVVELAKTGTLPIRTNWIVGNFCGGDTLGPAPK